MPYLPISGWHPFPSKALPKHFKYGNIYHYLVESVTSFDSIELCSDTDSDAEIGQSSSDVHTSKPFTKGRNLFRSGHVKNMEDNQQKKSLLFESYSSCILFSEIIFSDTHYFRKFKKAHVLVQQLD